MELIPTSADQKAKYNQSIPDSWMIRFDRFEGVIGTRWHKSLLTSAKIKCPENPTGGCYGHIGVTAQEST